MDKKNTLRTLMTKLISPLCGGEWKLHLGSYLFWCDLNGLLLWPEQEKISSLKIVPFLSSLRKKKPIYVLETKILASDRTLT